MRTVLTTTEPILLGYAQVLLTDAGVASVVGDQYVSAVEGAVGIFPRRLQVAEEDLAAARRVLEMAGLGQHLSE